METRVQATVETVEATSTLAEGCGDSTNTESSVKKSELEKFLAVRGLGKTQRRVGKVSSAVRLTAEALSKTYTKRRSGGKAAAQRAALGEAPDVFSDSVDVYVPLKREQELTNLHKDEQEVNDVFLKETRALSFEREVLDKIVCGREENRYEYEEKLWQLLVEVRGLQEVEDGEDDQAGSDQAPAQQAPAQLGQDQVTGGEGAEQQEHNES
ncbi:hypothetical protein PHYPSEUDO_007583 [Phytophthora pseudosyringae]|uniref:Uncharacterized protein n=1 Tax=Phytophthora pseudosyringae TaxID=221518 RepID=A0A8T1VJH3_9STRA|nr:hypothetical protein PHYPSEUDO_007583 [Phytophthora pseudosyringae]